MALIRKKHISLERCDDRKVHYRANGRIKLISILNRIDTRTVYGSLDFLCGDCDSGIQCVAPHYNSIDGFLHLLRRDFI